MPRRTPLPAALPSLAAALALAGCGGGEPAARAPGGRVAIALDEYLLRPQSVRARPGALTFELADRGRLAHHFQVRRGERPVADARTLMPGEQGRVTARLRRGEYRLVCTVANHEELGMYGTVVVR